MTKRWCYAVLGAIALAPLGAAWGQEDLAPPRRERPRATRPDRPAPGEWTEAFMKGLLDRLTKECALTEKQAAQVSQILQTQKQAVENWRKENGEKSMDLARQARQAAQAGNKEEAAKLRAELEKLAQSRHALHESLVKQLADVLSEEQMVKARPMLEPRRPALRLLTILPQLDLTGEQKEKVQGILAAARSAEGDKEKALRDAFEKIRTEVLTDEQRKKLQDALEPRPGDRVPLERLGLAPEQREAIQKIVRESRAQAAKAETPEAKKEIFEAAQKKILELLTEEQRQKWQQWKGSHPDGPREGMPGRVRERAKERAGRDGGSQP